MTNPLPEGPPATAPHAYVLEARHDGVTVRAELGAGGWRMTVHRQGRLTRWADNGTESVYRMAEAVCDVMATELLATPADLAEQPPPDPFPEETTR